jgi:hypothetical protein
MFDILLNPYNFLFIKFPGYLKQTFILIIQNGGIFMEWFSTLISSSAFWVTMGTIAFTIFMRSTITIFRMGATFKTEFATKGEQKEFEKQIIKDLREYKDELLKVTMAASMEMIREKLKDVDVIAQTAQQMKATEAKLEVQIKSAMEKVDEVRGMADNLRALNSKVERIEYGQNNSEIRRKER